MVLLVCFLPDFLDALHQPRGRGRGDKPRAVLRLGGGGRGDRGRGEDAGSHSKAEDWDEEKRIAALLGDKIIRKLSMKRWLEERHKFFPTPSAVERLRVEEGEEMRDRILAQEGWAPSKKLAQFYRPKRTRWEEHAKQAATLEDRNSHLPCIDLNRQPIPGGSRLWGVPELRGGGEGVGRTKDGWPGDWWRHWRRRRVDDLWRLEVTLAGQRFAVSVGGTVLDCILASNLLFFVHVIVDMTIAMLAARLLTGLLFPVLLPSLRDFPRVAGLSLVVAHWGMRLAKTAMSAFIGGYIVSSAASHRLAFQPPLLPVLYASAVSLHSSVQLLSRLAQDPRFRGVISLPGMALRLLTCEIPGLMLFASAAFSGKHAAAGAAEAQKSGWLTGCLSMWSQQLRALKAEEACSQARQGRGRAVARGRGDTKAGRGRKGGGGLQAIREELQRNRQEIRTVAKSLVLSGEARQEVNAALRDLREDAQKAEASGDARAAAEVRADIALMQHVVEEMDQAESAGLGEAGTGEEEDRGAWGRGLWDKAQALLAKENALVAELAARNAEGKTGPSESARPSSWGVWGSWVKSLCAWQQRESDSESNSDSDSEADQRTSSPSWLQQGMAGGARAKKQAKVAGSKSRIETLVAKANAGRESSQDTGGRNARTDRGNVGVDGGVGGEGRGNARVRSSSPIDYSKWDALVDSSEEECPQALKKKPGGKDTAAAGHQNKKDRAASGSDNPVWSALLRVEKGRGRSEGLDTEAKLSGAAAGGRPRAGEGDGHRGEKLRESQCQPRQVIFCGREQASRNTCSPGLLRH